MGVKGVPHLSRENEPDEASRMQNDDGAKFATGRCETGWQSRLIDRRFRG